MTERYGWRGCVRLLPPAYYWSKLSFLSLSVSLDRCLLSSHVVQVGLFQTTPSMRIFYHLLDPSFPSLFLRPFSPSLFTLSVRLSMLHAPAIFRYTSQAWSFLKPLVCCQCSAFTFGRNNYYQPYAFRIFSRSLSPNPSLSLLYPTAHMGYISRHPLTIGPIYPQRWGRYHRQL